MGDIIELLLELAEAHRHGNTRTLPPVTTAEVLERAVQEIRHSRHQEERAVAGAVALRKQLEDLRAEIGGEEVPVPAVGAGAEALAVLLRCRRGLQDCTHCPATSCVDNRSPEALYLQDLKAAAGEYLVPLPEPGTTVAKLLSANVLLRRKNEELRRKAGRSSGD